MAEAPIDMLRKCRGIFAGRAVENWAVSRGASRPEEYRAAASYMAAINENLVCEIEATLKEWG